MNKHEYTLISSSDEVFFGVEIVTYIYIIVTSFKIDFISQESSDSAESLHELESFLGFVSDEFKSHTVVLEVVAEPFSH